MKKKEILLIISIFLVVLILFSSSYALLFKSDQTDKQSYATGVLSITSEATNNSVTLNNALPMSDTDGASSTPYTFKITNTGNLSYKFNVMLLSTTTENQISAEYIKVKVNDNAPVKLNSLTNGVILSNITLKPEAFVEISLRVWLDESTPNTEIGKSFNAKITTSGEAVYTDTSEPSLKTLTKLGITPNDEPIVFEKTLPYILKTSTEEYESGTTGSLDLVAPTMYTLHFKEDDTVTYSSEYLYDAYTYKYYLFNPKSCVYKKCYNTLSGKYILNGEHEIYKVNSASCTTSGCSTGSGGAVTTDNKNDDNVVLPLAIATNDVRALKVKTPSTTISSSGSGVYPSVDDYGTSYYFRGNVSNNYAYFAGFYWRIIRINGDGSIRMIYDGRKLFNNNESSINRGISSSKFSSSVNDNTYAGFMYGSAGASSYDLTTSNVTSSTIKTVLDNWYATNLTDYSDYIADVIYCNDRSLSLGTGISNSRTTYIDYSTIENFICPQVNDMFTVESDLGNNSLTYPIGLITLNEVIAAGLDTSSFDNEITHLNNSSALITNYLYTGVDYWTMTPWGFDSSLYMYSVKSNATDFDAKDEIAATHVLANSTARVRPVISIKSNVKVSGDGSLVLPYTFSY